MEYEYIGNRLRITNLQEKMPLICMCVLDKINRNLSQDWSQEQLAHNKIKI